MVSLRGVAASALLTTLLGACDAAAPQATARTEAGPQAVEVVRVARRDLVETLSLVGSVEANESALMRAEIAGRVAAISFAEGQPVDRGEVLLSLDDRGLRAEVAQAEASFRFAEAALARQRQMRDRKAVSELEFDRTVSERDAALAELERLRDRLARMTIRAPFDGVAGARDVSPGDYLAAGATVTTVDDLSRLKVAFDVPERYVTAVREGTPLAIRSADGAGVLARGSVYFVSATIDPATRASRVKALLDERQADLRPGMFANVELVLDVHRDALTVPEAAILTSLEGTQVVVAEPHADGFRARFVPVRLGLRADGMVEVDAAEPIEDRDVVSAGVGALPLYPDLPLAPRPGTVSYAPLPSG